MLKFNGAAITTENIKNNTRILVVPFYFIHVTAQDMLETLNTPKTNISVLLLHRLSECKWSSIQILCFIVGYCCLDVIEDELPGLWLCILSMHRFDRH